ncbi:hypothetical protein ZIOFF_026559 [Zingiber officinale]|uniref:Mitochondrial protein n=1 Tax=Zingiber officinale TaxID=94328 RepID=A0A8J5H4T0_ZINOF|nr:hypothetical protein ZIOFF_026559 [Zingiber officinale]
MGYYLGIEVNQREDGSIISQAGYAREILKKFRMDNSKSINTQVECGVKLSKHDEEEKVDPTFFKSLVGSLRYLTYTRPDILYAVGLISRYMEDPTTTHLKAAKRILRYIKGTIDFGLLYSTSNHFKLEGYSDSDWGGDIDDRKSTIGFAFFMGDTAFTWMSKKQPIATLSTCEATGTVKSLPRVHNNIKWRHTTPQVVVVSEKVAHSGAGTRRRCRAWTEGSTDSQPCKQWQWQTPRSCARVAQRVLHAVPTIAYKGNPDGERVARGVGHGRRAALIVNHASSGNGKLAGHVLGWPSDCCMQCRPSRTRVIPTGRWLGVSARDDDDEIGSSSNDWKKMASAPITRESRGWRGLRQRLSWLVGCGE